MALSCLNIDALATKEEMGVNVSSTEDFSLPMVGTYAFALRKQREMYSRPRGVGDEAAAVEELFQVLEVEYKCRPPSSRPRRAISLKPRMRVPCKEEPPVVPTPPSEPRTGVYVRSRFRCSRELHPPKMEAKNVSTDADEQPGSRCSSTSLEGVTDDSCVWSSL